MHLALYQGLAHGIRRGRPPAGKGAENIEIKDEPNHLTRVLGLGGYIGSYQ